MVINRDESQLRTTEQIEQFLNASAEVVFTAHNGDVHPMTVAGAAYLQLAKALIAPEVIFYVRCMSSIAPIK